MCKTDSSAVSPTSISLVQVGNGALRKKHTMADSDLCRAPSSRPRVLLADDNPAILERVFHLLDGKYEIVGTLGSGSAVLAFTKSQRPDLMVLDISLGDMSGIEVARQLRESGYDGKIVFLTVHEDQDFVAAAFGAGASAYVVKSKLASDLYDAVSIALSGGMFVSANLGVRIGDSRF